MSGDTILQTSISQMLILQTVQLTIVAVCVFALARVFAKNSPHLSHALWALVLLKCITPPIIPSPTSPFSWFAAADVANTQPASGELVVQKPSEVNRASKSPNIAVGDFQLLASDPSVTGHSESSSARGSAPAKSNLIEANSSRRSNSQLLGMQPNTSADSIVNAQAGRSFLAPFYALTIRLWIFGAAIALLLLPIRLVLFFRKIRKHTVPTPEWVADLSFQLVQRLKIKRQVQIRVLDCSIGPAVMGVFRPVVLIPKSIVDSQQPESIKLILAHELVHVRRGDLFWSALQSFCMCLWWFHPLVRIAGKRLNRETERCCDEETIASLGCSAATYARSLLQVLELRETLQAPPAMPGIRPVEITARRMERIMSIGNGVHSRRPWWALVVLMLGALIVLPGAAMVSGQESRKSRRAETDLNKDVQHTSKIVVERLKFEYEPQSVLGPIRETKEQLDGPDDAELAAAWIAHLDNQKTKKNWKDGGEPEFLAQKIASYDDPARDVPLIGRVQQHHSHYKVKVHRKGNPKEVYDVFYIDQNYFFRVQSGKLPAGLSSTHGAATEANSETRNESPRVLPRKEPTEFLNLTLDDCIRLALQNSPMIRVENVGKAPHTSVKISPQDQRLGLLEFETQVADLIRDVESSYWDLVFGYRAFEAAKSNQQAALEVWRTVQTSAGAKAEAVEAEAQARALYHQFRALVHTTLIGNRMPGTEIGLFVREAKLRQQIGLSPADGRTIRPTIEPDKSQKPYDWQSLLSNTLKNNISLRKGRESVKLYELELKQSEEAVVAANQTTNAGTSGPRAFGKRRLHATLQHSRIRLSKEKALLEEKERALQYQLSEGVKNCVVNADAVERCNQNRVTLETELETCRQSNASSDVPSIPVINSWLIALEKYHRAECSYHQALCEYNKSLSDTRYLSGSLLEDREVFLDSD
ncbi:MAG: M56 family metallopeptidase [Planctomycetota bacterium]